MEKHFTTTDIGLAAALMIKEYHLDAVDRTSPSKVQFKFLSAIDIEECSQEYFSGMLNVSALDFNNQLRSLKSMIYSTSK